MREIQFLEDNLDLFITVDAQLNMHGEYGHILHAYLLNIFKSIPIPGNKTIFDNLIECCRENYNGSNISKSIGRGHAVPTDNSMFNKKNWKSKSEYYKLIMRLINMVLMSDDRLKENEKTFINYIDPKEQATINVCHELAGPIIGLEAEKATLYAVSKGYQTTYFETENPFNYGKRDIYVSKGPYDEVIFKHWVNYLKNKGVKIFNNTKITSINYNHKINKIISVSTSKYQIYGDDYIICLDQNSIADLIKKNNTLRNIPSFGNILDLAKYGNEYYFGMLLFFSEKAAVDFDIGCSSDQPWKPVIQRFNSVWENKYIKRCNCQEIWQISVLDLVKGYNKKILSQSSVKEIIKEIFIELKKSKFTGNIKTYNGKLIWNTLVDYQIWPYWKNNSQNKIYNTLNEYKLSINKNCLKNMPNYITEIPNIYFGSVIAKGDQPFISQEMACTNGRRVAQIICKKYNIKPVMIKRHNGTCLISLFPVRLLDKIFYYCGININQIIILLFVLLIYISIIIIIIIYLMKFIKYKKFI